MFSISISMAVVRHDIVPLITLNDEISLRHWFVCEVIRITFFACAIRYRGAVRYLLLL